MRLRQRKQVGRQSDTEDEELVPVLPAEYVSNLEADKQPLSSDLVTSNELQLELNNLDSSFGDKTRRSDHSLDYPFEYTILTSFVRESHYFTTPLKSVAARSLLLSLLPAHICCALDNFLSKSQIDQIGGIKMLIQTLNETHFEDSPCSSLSCSLLCSFLRRSICQIHSQRILMDAFGIILSIFSIPFSKLILLQDNHKINYWIQIGEFTICCIQHSFKIDAHDEFLKALRKEKQSALILSFATESEECSVVNSRFKIGLKPSLKKWISKFCTIEHRKYATDASAIPTSLSGFANHQLYVLQSKMPKCQVLKPGAKQVADFRGIPVYLRTDLSPIKSQEAWMRQGRTIKSNEIPIVQREYTPRVKKRADEHGKAMLSLYAEWQTDKYIPPAAINGIVPKNAFGNVELFCAEMLPSGCTHLAYPGIDKIARKLEVDYADAVVGFSFKKGRAAPKTCGIVVCDEVAERLEKAFHEYRNELQRFLQEAAKLEEEKRAAIMRKLDRLVDEFGGEGQGQLTNDEIYHGKKRKKAQQDFSFDDL